MIIGIDGRVLQEGEGGIFVYAKNLLPRLAVLARERGHKVKIFFNRWKKNGDFSLPSAAEICQCKFPNKIFNFGLRFLNRPRLDDLIGGCDVFFSPSPLYFSLSEKARFVLTVHDLSFLAYPEFFTGKQNLWHKLLKLPGMLGRADKIIAVSEHTKQDLIKFYQIPENKIKAIYSGVDNKFFASSPAAAAEKLREKYGLPKDKKFILSTGTFEPRKNHLALARAFSVWQKSEPESAGQYDLLLAGHRGWKNRPLLDALDKLKKAGRAHCFVDYPACALLDFYKLADFFVYPSFYEGFGLPIIEAMAAGLPVITSTSSSLPEISGGAAVLVDPYRPDDLAAAFQKLTAEPEFRRQLQERGLLRARQFSWKKTVEETLKQLTFDN